MQVAKAQNTTSHVIPNEHLIDDLLVSQKTTDLETLTIPNQQISQQHNMHRFLEANCDCV